MPATVCANCGNPQGPFQFVEPGVRVCPPGPALNPDGTRVHPKTQHAPIKACLARRDKLDNEAYGSQPE